MKHLIILSAFYVLLMIGGNWYINNNPRNTMEIINGYTVITMDGKKTLFGRHKVTGEVVGIQDTVIINKLIGK